MNISELIAELEKVKKEYADITVLVNDDGRDEDASGIDVLFDTDHNAVGVRVW